MQKIKLLNIETKNQIRDLTSLAKIIWEEYYIPIIGEEQVIYMTSTFQSEDAIANQINNENYQYFFITLNGDNAGYMAIKFEDEKIFLSKLYIEKSFRKNGLARFAMECLQNIFVNENIKEIYLTVNKNNSGSIKAYKRLGFSITDQVCTDIGNGFIMDDYIMSKPV